MACNLCGGREVSVLSMRSRCGAALRTVACRDCGLVWSDPRPHDARRFYEDDYRLDYKRTFEPQPKHALRAGQVALSRLERIERWLGGRMRILDVGSGGGEFAYLLASLGHDVRGIEPNRGYAVYAAAQYGLDIARAFVDEVELEPASFDLITIWHVLEHTEDPGAVLRKLRDALRPGGVLVVEVPNVEATCQSPRSTFHEAHLYNFNAATLHRLARKAGLAVAASSLSDDGGNITAVFRAAPAADGVDLALPGNHDRVARIVRNHTPIRHLLSSNPYRRAARRFGRSVAEAIRTRRSASGKPLLDELYRQRLSPSAHRPQPAPGVRPIWPWLVAAYLLAVTLEWLLLDGSMQAAGWTEPQALGAYMGVQASVVLGFAWTLRPRLSRRRDYLGFSAWALPLFLIPAYC